MFTLINEVALKQTLKYPTSTLLLCSTSGSTTSSLSYSEDDRLAILAMAIATAPSLFQQPCYISPYTGHDWVKELMHPDTHPDHIRKSLGIRLHVFGKFLHVLKRIECSDSKYVTLEEQLAIFLHACVTGLRTCHLCERFQRSGEMICK
jgi:hypothetical protein